MSKYPNADTSPERLAFIEGDFNQTPPFDRFGRAVVRDLLAMLQERSQQLKTISELSEQLEEDKNDLEETCEKLTQQLHDQWWRRRDEEEPGLAQVVVVESEDPSRSDGDKYITICFGVSEIDEPWMWWFSLPRREGEG